MRWQRLQRCEDCRRPQTKTHASTLRSPSHACTRNLQRGLDAATRAMAKANASGAQSQAARAQTFRGYALRKLGRLSESEAAFQAARRVYEVTGDRGNLKTVLANLGEIARERGDLDEARNAFAADPRPFRLPQMTCQPSPV